MAGLLNSHRRIAKATYVPLAIPKDHQEKRSGRALEKAAFYRSLKVTPAELELLAKQPELAHMAVTTTAGSPPLIAVMRDLAANPSPVSLKRFGPALASASFDALKTFGTSLLKLRNTTAARIGAPPASHRRHSANADMIEVAAGSAADVANALEHLEYISPITPVGKIHLERLEMTPVGVEHGELVHSIGLAPKETVNVTHREWSTTTQTFENMSHDSFEGFSEEGVAEKNDLALATAVESKHASSLDVNGSVSASYNGGAYSVTASAAINYNTKDESQQSEKRSIAHSMAVTRNASARTKKEHKTSFRVSSVAGAEDLAVQVISNPSETQAMRIDYYQMLRKWRVDLIRYGLRMTYDIVIPNPGVGMVGKVRELRALDQVLVRGNTFSLDPSAITVDNWMTFAARFGASIDAPPKPSVRRVYNARIAQQTYTAWGVGLIQIEVPEGYIITHAHFRGHFALYDFTPGPNHRRLQVNIPGEPAGTTNVDGHEVDDANATIDMNLTEGTLLGRSGSALLTFEYYNLDFGNVVVEITAEPTKFTVDAWRNKVWTQLREADHANYESKLVLARDRKAQLEAELAGLDALTLRKMEREEVMRGVLEWLLGPHFELMPKAVIDAIIRNVSDVKASGQAMTPGEDSGSYEFPIVSRTPWNDWQSIMQHGELIKFLHSAIEWENMLFFAYPYFWDRWQNWDFKRFLIHPDHAHRDFLRAGATRVVLPVRPGFETSFAMLMETADATAPPDASYPYVSIGEAIRNDAMTNYENIPPANPDRNVRTLLHTQQRRAWADIQAIMQALARYHADHRETYPNSLSDPALAEAAAALGMPLPDLDPWGVPYHYAAPGVFGDYDLWTAGTTLRPDVDGLDEVVSSWAEGAIVGRWYEFTPTSALDIAVTMIAADQTPLKTRPEPA